MKTKRINLFGYGVSIFVAVVSLWSHALFAAGSDVTECDLLASKYNDPEKVADGVATQDLDVELALTACEQALTDDPNNPRLQFEYGRVFFIKMDDALAYSWFLKAANQNYAAAQGYLGEMYEFGYGVKADLQQALSWYRKSAGQNYNDAQFALGYYYFQGEGLPESLQDAYHWFQKAADQNQADALFYVGAFYHNGDIVAKNEAKAQEYWIKALATESGTSNVQSAKVELFFSWAETQYSDALPGFAKALPPDFPPPYNNYQYRHYTAAGNDIYLAYNPDDKNLYYLGPLTGNQVANLGTFDSWYRKYLASGDAYTL